MYLELTVPPCNELPVSACSVSTAPRGEKWSELCLGDDRKEHGCYVIWHSGQIIYVGKTDGPSMSFVMRLRREFQESASGGRHIYPKLRALQPPDFTVSLLPLPVLKNMVTVHDATLSDPELIQICEVALIAAYKPMFQN